MDISEAVVYYPPPKGRFVCMHIPFLWMHLKLQMFARHIWPLYFLFLSLFFDCILPNIDPVGLPGQYKRNFYIKLYVTAVNIDASPCV